MEKGLAGVILFLLLAAPVSPLAEKDSRRSTAGEPSRPPVFLITLDTLRADRLEPYGYKSVRTPALNRLAADGIRFEQAFTPSPLTNTSHASILTGLLPSSHGVADFAVPLSGSSKTLAELLRERGYQTAAFPSAVILDSKSLAPGFDRGFDSYRNFPSDVPKQSSRYGRVERRAADTFAEAQRWILAHQKSAKPAFVWVHLYDPHDPYDPPVPYAQPYRSRPYDGEIAYTDRQLLKFLNFLQQHRQYDNSLIIAVADHGEGLGEHGEDTHGIFLYDSTLRVPLIIKLPGRQSAGTVVGTQVRTTDIAPTILDALRMPNRAKFEGESLLPLINNESAADRTALGETDYPLRYGWAPLKSARNSSFKYIDAPRPELYDLRSDPDETKSIYEPWHPEVQKLRALVADLREKTSEKRSDNPAAPDPQTIEELKALGYLGTNPGATTAASPSLLPDPKGKIELHNLLHAAMLADEEGDNARAQNLLRSALEKDADSPVALLQLGQVELSQKSYRSAAEYLGRARALRPEDPSAAFYHGKALYGAGDLEGAKAAFEAGLKLSAGQFEARFLLGKVYAEMKNWNAAQDQLEAAVFLDPKKPEARIELARVLLHQQRHPLAAEQLEEAGKLSSQNPEIFELLTTAYKGFGQQQKAAAAGRRARALRSKKQGAAAGALHQP